jgi:hypothetical protein
MVLGKKAVDVANSHGFGFSSSGGFRGAKRFAALSNFKRKKSSKSFTEQDRNKIAKVTVEVVKVIKGHVDTRELNRILRR